MGAHCLPWPAFSSYRKSPRSVLRALIHALVPWLCSSAIETRQEVEERQARLKAGRPVRKCLQNPGRRRRWPVLGNQGVLENDFFFF